MQTLLRNIRFYVLLVSLLLSGVILLWVKIYIPGSQLQNVRLEQTYGIISLVYLYLTLLAGPLSFRFRQLPFRGQYLKARRALGVAVFYFAFLHSSIALFGQLGGFAGLDFLSNTFLIAVILGFIAVIIFFFLAITSLDIAVVKLTFPKWKLLHRFVYLAGILTLIHTIMLGTHYSDLTGNISEVTFIALIFLLLLEAPRIDAWLNKKFLLPPFRFTTTILLLVFGIIYFTIFFPFTANVGKTISFDVHAAHKQLAQQAFQQSQFSSNQFSANIDITKIPGLNGDRNKRYTVSFNNPENVQPNQDVILRFRIYDASSGIPVSFYRIIYAKTMHMIAVDSSLSYFNHIHPTQEGNDFVITTQFPTAGMYHIYLEFQPYGGIEQQVGFTLPVGIDPNTTVNPATQSPDSDLTKVFGNYEVTFTTRPLYLSASEMSLGNDMLSFTIRDAKTKQPIKTLKPYLASFGHLTMINETTYDFIHVHPYSFVVPPPNASSGPTVDFLPIGIYGPFKPGVYRAFAEFNPDGQLFTADFTVHIY